MKYLEVCFKKVKDGVWEVIPNSTYKMVLKVEEGEMGVWMRVESIELPEFWSRGCDGSRIEKQMIEHLAVISSIRMNIRTMLYLMRGKADGGILLIPEAEFPILAGDYVIAYRGEEAEDEEEDY